MARTSDAPADTTMMRIVHDALRRDLARAKVALSEPTGASRDRRRAVGAHLGWMMRFLHAHHASEDDGLYPLVRERARDDAEALGVLDRMTREHQAIAAPISAVEATAAPLAADGSDPATRRAIAALDALAAVLLPHLRAEEDDAMPLTSRLVTAAEWDAIDKKHNLDPKSMSDLGFEGHWLIDSASDADRATVTRLVPPIPRFILLHGFARVYRRRARARWQPGIQAERAAAR